MIHPSFSIFCLSFLLATVSAKAEHSTTTEGRRPNVNRVADPYPPDQGPVELPDDLRAGDLLSHNALERFAGGLRDGLRKQVQENQQSPRLRNARCLGCLEANLSASATSQLRIGGGFTVLGNGMRVAIGNTAGIEASIQLVGPRGKPWYNSVTGQIREGTRVRLNYTYSFGPNLEIENTHGASLGVFSIQASLGRTGSLQLRSGSTQNWLMENAVGLNEFSADITETIAGILGRRSQTMMADLESLAQNHQQDLIAVINRGNPAPRYVPPEVRRNQGRNYSPGRNRFDGYGPR